MHEEDGSLGASPISAFSSMCQEQDSWLKASLILVHRWVGAR